MIVVVDATFFDERERNIQRHGIASAMFGKTEVRSKNNRVGKFRQHIGEIGFKNVVARKHITGDREKALNLPGVEVHGDIAVCTGDFHHLSNQFGGDGHTRLVLAVGSSVAHVRENNGNATSRVEFEGLCHDEQFHQIAMNRHGSGLNDVTILSSDRGMELYEKVFVCELNHITATKFKTEIFSNFLCQLH